MISNDAIQEAVRLLRDAAQPARIIMFGSYASGSPGGNSDVDFLVVEENLESRHSEMVRLRDILSPLRIPVDIIVVSVDTYNEWKDTPGTVIYEAACDGKVLYEAS